MSALTSTQRVTLERGTNGMSSVAKTAISHFFFALSTRLVLILSNSMEVSTATNFG